MFKFIAFFALLVAVAKADHTCKLKKLEYPFSYDLNAGNPGNVQVRENPADE
jgi:hypothetical protein